MNPKDQNGYSLIKTGSLAILAGVFIGIFYICFEWSWNNFLSGIAAGIAFTVTLFLTTVVLKLPKHGVHLYLHTVGAGLAAGLAWWCVSATHMSLVTPIIIGGFAAPMATRLETREHSKKMRMGTTVRK